MRPNCPVQAPLGSSAFVPHQDQVGFASRSVCSLSAAAQSEVCVYVCGEVLMHMNLCVWATHGRGGQRLTLGVFLTHSPP